MFTSFDENNFYQSIESIQNGTGTDRDFLRLKVNTVSSMRNDPTFVEGETEKVLNVLNEKVPQIFENEVKLDYEEHLEKSAWDKDYFTKLTFWFQENFAKSRVDYIKEVGRVVHQDTAQRRAESEDLPTSQAKRSEQSNNTAKQGNPTHAPEKKNKKLFQIVAAIAGVAALVLLISTIIKALTK